MNARDALVLSMVIRDAVIRRNRFGWAPKDEAYLRMVAREAFYCLLAIVATVVVLAQVALEV